MVMKDDKTKKIISDIKNCSESVGISIATEEVVDQHVILYSAIEGNAYTILLQLTFTPAVEIIFLAAGFSVTVPLESMEVLCELANIVNSKMLTDYVTICPDSGLIMLHNSILVTDSSLDKDQFKFSLNQILTDASLVFRLFYTQIHSELSPKEHFIKFISENKESET
jgi:hypothetical protein